MPTDNATVILDTTDPDLGDDDSFDMSELIAPPYRTAEETAARQAQLEREDIAASNAYRTARLNGADKAAASHAAGVARRTARIAGGRR